MKVISTKFLFCLCGGVDAQISVTAVQPPLWKESNGNKTALFTGDLMAANNIIYIEKKAEYYSISMKEVLLNLGKKQPRK